MGFGDVNAARLMESLSFIKFYLVGILIRIPQLWATNYHRKLECLTAQSQIASE